MPETPDFNTIAKRLLNALYKAGGSDRPVASEQLIRDQLREVWNAHSDLEPVVRDAHARLDRAGVPNVDGHACDDPTCQSTLEHRIKLLVAERDRLRHGTPGA